MSVTVDTVAVCKMTLHAARYCQRAVSGVLLGPAPSAGVVTVQEAVPLFHHVLSLTAMLNDALEQVEERYADAGLQIVGYYQANENIADVEPDFVATKICEKIAENGGSACLLMLNGRLLSPDMARPPFAVSQLSADGKWRQRDGATVSPGALEAACSLLLRRAQHDLVDFDLHLDDISKDWANTQVNAFLENC